MTNQTTRYLTYLVCVSILASVSASCRENEELVDPEAITNDREQPAADQTEVSAPRPIGDDELAAEISEDMFFDDAVPAHRVNVMVENGIVTLEGRVRTLRADERAVQIAESMRGTKSVIDRLEVEPPARTDREVQTDIEDALRADPVADAFDIGVSVHDGTATLSGVVGLHEERLLARQVVAGVRGVRSVDTHDVVVDYQADRPDVEIARDIESRLRNDLSVDDALIDVTVNDGDVTLAGTVGSVAEMREAERDAWVDGTTGVDTDGLEVEYWARDDQHREGLAIRTDDELESALESAYQYDPRLTEFDVDVGADSGLVTLRGTVDNAAAREAAAQDARNTPGVWNVRNLIRVVPPLDIQDATIATMVSRALARSPFLENDQLSTVVIDGDVFLNGSVGSELERDEAIMIARSTTGVTEVDADISVPEVREKRFDDWEIRRSLEAHLRFDPWIDPNMVAVSVKDGVAEVSGHVGSLMAYRHAMDDAFDAGAREVKADLVIDGAPDSVQPAVEDSAPEAQAG